jgi:hypothetical protein
MDEGGIRFSPNINIITGGENNISGIGPDTAVAPPAGERAANPVVVESPVNKGGGHTETTAETAEPNFNQPLMVVKKS